MYSTLEGELTLVHLPEGSTCAGGSCSETSASSSTAAIDTSVSASQSPCRTSQLTAEPVSGRQRQNDIQATLLLLEEADACDSNSAARS